MPKCATRIKESPCLFYKYIFYTSHTIKPDDNTPNSGFDPRSSGCYSKVTINGHHAVEL